MSSSSITPTSTPSPQSQDRISTNDVIVIGGFVASVVAVGTITYILVFLLQYYCAGRKLRQMSQSDTMYATTTIPHEHSETIELVDMDATADIGIHGPGDRNIS
ncbi:hypothetical protein BKA63DRAFT_495372 [Paraphoma chrysanthemicola]|nr:hypothetical protein BKA63DRAFT_495372 [Paraphoma chrysanthemicola]